MKIGYRFWRVRGFRLVAIGLLVAAGSPLHAQFIHDLTGDRRPWTKPVEVEGGDYRFVVLADKTGGPETGAFLQAVEEVNRLAPDFVVSIGDLIDGYVAAPEAIREQWRRLLSMTERLEAPFFFVGGNHDLSNEPMRREWIARFGTTYYHFNVGRDLFMVLDTEEPGGISDRQIDYFTQVLRHWKGRWIYLFMHRPLWYPHDHGGFASIDSLLQGHDYTVFSGHEHRYYKELRNGHAYYIMATTGGDSALRGVRLGEFDHYFHVTARDSAPVIANLSLGGLLPDDAVNSETKPMVDAMTGTNYIETVPVVLSDEYPESFDFEIKAVNRCAQAMAFTATLPDVEGLTFSPSHVDDCIAPDSERIYSIHAVNASKLSAERFAQFPIRSSCGYRLAGEPVAVSTEKTMLLDWNRTMRQDEACCIACDNPAYVGERWDWHGPDDGRFTLRVERIGEELVITVSTTDDRLIRSDDATAPQDRLAVFLATDAADGFTEKTRYDFVPGKPMQGGTEQKQGKVRGSCKAEKNGMTAKLTVPMSGLQTDAIRLNAAFTDSDDEQNTKPSVLWWKPPWDGSSEFVGSGVFIFR